MKITLKFSAAVVAVALMAVGAVAQTSTTTSTTTPAASSTSSTTKKAKKSSSGGAAAKADNELAALTKSLTLTDDQQAKIKPILADESAKIRAGHKKGSTTSDADSKAANKVIRDDANKQIRALLTPDQQKIFDASLKKGGTNKSAAAAPAA